MAASSLKRLTAYTACDVSDALLKLKVHNAGHIPDLIHLPPSNVTSDRISLLPRVAAPASTVLMVPKTADPTKDLDAFHGIAQSNIPKDQHWVDLTKSGTVVVMKQPKGQTCAVLGGIMASRMKKIGARGVVVGGRLRDKTELGKLHFPIWSTGTSTVGTGLEAKPWALNVPVTIQGTTVNPGDIVFSDPIEGVVVIPRDKLDEVLSLMPKLTAADDKVKDDVELGVTVKEAFAKHRSGL